MDKNQDGTLCKDEILESTIIQIIILVYEKVHNDKVKA